MKAGDLIYDLRSKCFATILYTFKDGAMVSLEKPQQNTEILGWDEMAIAMNIDQFES
jgi:hypothetical protein